MQVKLCAAFDCARPLGEDKSRWCERACYIRMYRHDGVEQTDLKVKTYEVNNAHPSTGPGYDRFISEGYHELVLCEGWSKAAVAREAGVSATSVSNWLDAWALTVKDSTRGEAQNKRRAEVRARKNMMFPDVMSFRAKCFPNLLRPDFHAEWGRQIDSTVGTGERLLLLASQRHGKLLADSTPVLTPDGWRTHGDLAVGDRLYAPDGSVTRVIGVKPKAMATLEVEFSHGSVIKCHPQHLWTVYDRSRHGYFTYETQEMLERGLTEGIKTKVNRFNVDYCEPLEPGVEADLPLDPYFLGVWLGDGSADKPGFVGNIEDMQDIELELKRRGMEASSGGGPTQKDFRWTYFSGITKKMRELDLFGNKHIPDVYFTGAVQQRREVLAGLVDTDGSVDSKSGRVRFVTCEDRLRDDVIRLVHSLGYRASHHTVTPEQANSYDNQLGIVSRRDCHYIQWTPHDGEPQGLLERKRVDRRGQAIRRDRRSIVDIRVAEEPEQGNCIAVDHPSRLYCVGDRQVPTHNTEFLMHYCMWRIIEDPDISILWVSKTMDLAEKMVGTIKRMFQYYEPVTSLLPDGQQFHTSQRTGAKWTDGEFTVATRTDMTKKSPTMVALGTGGTILGRDADLIIIDDPQDRARCMSPSHREKDKEWFFTDFMSRKEEHTGVAFIMSRQHEDDLPGAILADHAEDWQLAVYPAHDPACTIPESSDMHGECVLWPEKRTYQWLMKQKRANPEHFARNYMMQPASDSMQFLSAEDIEDRKDHEHRAGERFSGRLVAGIDPASAKPTAAVLWGVRDGKRFLIDAVEAAPGTKGIREVIKSWALMYGCRRFVLETNGYQGQALADRDVRELVQRMGVTMIPQHTGVNKNDPRSGVVAMLHGIANPEGDYVLPGSGDAEVMMRLDQLYRQWLMFDPDALNARHAKDDLVMASWIAQAEVERVSRANKQKVVFLEDRTNYGGSSYGELTAYAGR